MKTKRFRAPDRTTALRQIRDELGPDALILQEQRVKPGLFGLLGAPQVEIVAGIEENGNGAATGRAKTKQRTVSSIGTRMSIPQVNDPIVNSGDAVSDDETGNEAVEKPDQASHEGYLVSDKKLSQQAEMRPHHIAAFENQPVRRDEDSQADDNPRHNSLYSCVQSQKPGQDDLLQSFSVFGHGLTVRF